ncbi:MAG: hypothetical protein JJV93_02450 [Alphaproteobacteria bacterium]|nr:hypothetical protein [Alphaproteobacteria bacterium]
MVKNRFISINIFLFLLAIFPWQLKAGLGITLPCQVDEKIMKDCYHILKIRSLGDETAGKTEIKVRTKLNGKFSKVERFYKRKYNINNEDKIYSYKYEIYDLKDKQENSIARNKIETSSLEKYNEVQEEFINSFKQIRLINRSNNIGKTDEE